MKKQRCPKCGAKTYAANSGTFRCLSKLFWDMDSEQFLSEIQQSSECRERCKVAKLKRQVEKLKKKLKDSEIVSATFDPKSWELTCTRGDGMTTFLIAKQRRDGR